MKFMLDTIITCLVNFSDRVELTMNLNHSVDTDVSEDDLNPKAENAPDAEMKSKPQFDVKLIKGSKTVQLACSCVREVGPDDDGASECQMFVIT